MSKALDYLGIRLHLRRVARRLAQSPVEQLSPGQRDRRRWAIRELNRYRRFRRLPRNTYVPGRRPVFVDERGAHCAVAHLVAASGARDVVERTKKRENLAYVREMSDPALQRWATDHGLTVGELAEIQPGYPRWTHVVDWSFGRAMLEFVAASASMLAVTGLILLRRSWRRPAFVFAGGLCALAISVAGISVARSHGLVTRVCDSGRPGTYRVGVIPCTSTTAPSYVGPALTALWALGAAGLGLAAGTLLVSAISRRRRNRARTIVEEAFDIESFRRAIESVHRSRTPVTSWMKRWFDRRSNSDDSQRFAAYSFEYGENDEDDMAISPESYAACEAQGTYSWLSPRDLMPAPDSSWPVIPGSRVVFAFGKGDYEVTPVAIVSAGSTGDISLLEWLAGRVGALPSAEGEPLAIEAPLTEHLIGVG